MRGYFGEWNGASAGDWWGGADVVIDTVTGGKGDNDRRRVAKTIFKPTGLDGYRKPVDARVEQSHEVALEVAGKLARELAEDAPKLVFPHVSLTNLRDKYGNLIEISPDDELAILILVAASV